MQFPVLLGELEPDPVGVQDLGPGDVLQIGLVEGVGSLAFQGIQGELDVLDGDRTAVRETGPLVDGEDDREPVGGQFDILGDQAVFGEGLVQAGDGQGSKTRLSRSSGAVPFRVKGFILSKPPRPCSTRLPPLTAFGEV